MSVKYWKGGNAGVEGSWAESLTSKTLTASAVEDLGGTPNKVRIACSHADDFIENDYVVIAGTTYYDGNYRITNISDATHFDIEHAFTAETPEGSDTAKSSNWQDEDGIPVAVPAASDTVIFDESAGIATEVSSLHIEGKRWNCISDIAVGDTGGLELNGMMVERGYDGWIAIDAQYTISPLHISIADGYALTFKGNEKAYIECSAADAVTDKNIPLLIFDTVSGYLQISSDVNSGSWTSLWSEVRCLGRGTLELANATACEIIRMYNSMTTLIIGTGCVEVKDSNDEIDLYINPGNVYADAVAKTTIVTDGPVNFGSAACKISRSR